MRLNKTPSDQYGGKDLVSYLASLFEEKMKSEGFTDLQAWDEIAATDIPSYGKNVKGNSREKLQYQTWLSEFNPAGGLDQFADEVRELNGGRLAAALKPTPKAKG
jgi:hypothetical protein